MQIGVFVILPFVLAVPPILGWFIGKWLDKHLHTSPYLKYVFLILGILAGIRECYRLIKEYGDKP
jgi:ATP synthase protein I